MLWRRAEDRWAKARRGRRRPGGTRRAGGLAVGVTEEGWRRGLLEKGGTLSPGAVVGRQGSWPPPIYTRWWATLPNASPDARGFKISQSLREGNCKRSRSRGSLRGVFRPSLLLAASSSLPAVSRCLQTGLFLRDCTQPATGPYINLLDLPNAHLRRSSRVSGSLRNMPPALSALGAERSLSKSRLLTRQQH
jgi:hypothetical protein